jgi:hypothetical protein
MRIKTNIATSGDGFIFNPATGDSFSGNGMASEILRAMVSGQTEPQIKQFILSKYEVSADQLDHDWEDWMLQLKEADLLETE